MEIIAGNEIAARLRKQVAEDAGLLVAQGVTPTLAVILVGEDPASKIYVRRKIEQSKEAGGVGPMTIACLLANTVKAAGALRIA